MATCAPGASSRECSETGDIRATTVHTSLVDCAASKSVVDDGQGHDQAYSPFEQRGNEGCCPLVRNRGRSKGSACMHAQLARLQVRIGHLDAPQSQPTLGRYPMLWASLQLGSSQR